MVCSVEVSRGREVRDSLQCGGKGNMASLALVINSTGGGARGWGVCHNFPIKHFLISRLD